MSSTKDIIIKSIKKQNWALQTRQENFKTLISLDPEQTQRLSSLRNLSDWEWTAMIVFTDLTMDDFLSKTGSKSKPFAKEHFNALLTGVLNKNKSVKQVLEHIICFLTQDTPRVVPSFPLS